MSEIARIYMKPRSGMTTAAISLACGLISSGVRAYLVVPTNDDAQRVPAYYPKGMIRVASCDSLIDPAEAYVFDDAERCAYYFNQQGQGDMLACVRQRFITFEDDVARVYLFQHSL